MDDRDNLSTFSELTSISRVVQDSMGKNNQLLQLAKTYPSYSSLISAIPLDVITVELELLEKSILGLSIYSKADGGVYVCSITDGSLAQRDGRINVGDMILQINNVSFENLSSIKVLSALNAAVSKPGPIKLVVAKYSFLRSLNAFGKQPAESASSEDTLDLRDQPVRPIDPRAWLEHTKQVNQSATESNPPEIDINNIQLTTEMEMLSIARAMSAPDSGLEIKDRTWLKITFSNAFLGSDVVSWLYSSVQGFGSRKEAKKYAVNMLKNGYIRHTLNKSSFSERCYYTFGVVAFIPSVENLSVDENCSS